MKASVSDYPGEISVDANGNVHYHHCTNGYSCHGRVKRVTLQEGSVEVTSSNENKETVHLLDPWVRSVDVNKSVKYF